MRSVRECGVVVAAAVLGVACSDEGTTSREEPMGPATMVAPAMPAAGGSAAPTATPGTPSTGVAAPSGDGAMPGTPALANPGAVPGSVSGRPLGDALEFVPGTGMVPYAIGPNAYGISGGGFLARSTMGNTVTVGADPGKICISGSLEEVPLNPDGHGNYGPYWGIEFGFNLNQAPAEGAAAPSAAGAAGAPAMDVAQPWHPGNVVGFSFVIEGP